MPTSLVLRIVIHGISIVMILSSLTIPTLKPSLSRAAAIFFSETHVNLLAALGCFECSRDLLGLRFERADRRMFGRHVPTFSVGASPDKLAFCTDREMRAAAAAKRAAIELRSRA